MRCQVMLDRVPTLRYPRAPHHAMPKTPRQKGRNIQGGTWNFRDVPKDLMRRAKAAAAFQGRSVKGLLIELMEAHLEDLEHRGIMPKGK